jgi:CheY-like chemotaxis protein
MKSEIRWDVKRGTSVYQQVSDDRLKRWIKTGKIKAGEVVVWRENLSGWRKPEEIEELSAFFRLYEQPRLRKIERRELRRRTGPGIKQIKNILLIDDEKELCFLLGDSLSSRGFQIEFAHTKKEALKLMKSQLPNLVLLDLRLPDGDGMTLLPAIRKMTPAPAVIITTAFGSEETRSDAKELGAYGFLDKPYDEEDVIRQIREIWIKGANAGKSEVKKTG